MSRETLKMCQRCDTEYTLSNFTASLPSYCRPCMKTINKRRLTLGAGVSKLTREDKLLILDLVRNGATIRSVAEKYDIKYSTMAGALKRNLYVDASE
jgi:hypothetical protein